MTISILGNDISKNTFQLYGTDDSGKVVLKKRLLRSHLVAYVSNISEVQHCDGIMRWRKLLGPSFYQNLP